MKRASILHDTLSEYPINGHNELALEYLGQSCLSVLDGVKINSGQLPVWQEETLTFAGVGGMRRLKEYLRYEVIRPFNNLGFLSWLKRKTSGGILLYGPPLCGKFRVAKAVAGECGARLIVASIPGIIESESSEQIIKNIFTTAVANEPCVIFFDEIETLGYTRAKLSRDHSHSTVDQLITGVEGLDPNQAQILVLASTNLPWEVDSLFMGRGRFDRLIFIAPPDAEAREAIFRLKLQDLHAEAIDYKFLARQTEFYSGADIENLVDAAVAYAFDDIMDTGVERPILMRDLLHILEGTRPSTLEWFTTIKDYVKHANQSGIYNDVEEYMELYMKEMYRN